MKKSKIIIPVLLIIAICIAAFSACPSSNGNGNQNQGHAVTFNANGGTGGPAALTNTTQITAQQATPAPTKDGYSFGGWAATATGTTPITFPHTITRKTTLYAIWSKDTPPPPAPIVSTVFGMIIGSSNWYTGTEYIDYKINGDTVDVSLKGGANAFAINFKQVAGTTAGEGVATQLRDYVQGSGWNAWRDAVPHTYYDATYGNQHYLVVWRDNPHPDRGGIIEKVEIRFRAANETERVVAVNISYTPLQDND